MTGPFRSLPLAPAARPVRWPSVDECSEADRLCPNVDCRYHLWHEVFHGGNADGALSNRVRLPKFGCALDHAGHEHTLEELGEVLGVSYETARAWLSRAIESAKARGPEE